MRQTEKRETFQEERWCMLPPSSSVYVWFHFCLYLALPCCTETVDAGYMRLPPPDTAVSNLLSEPHGMERALTILAKDDFYCSNKGIRRDNGQKKKLDKFRLEIRHTHLRVTVINHWYNLLSLDILKKLSEWLKEIKGLETTPLYTNIHQPLY
ncbi:unnamed protein product [Caretta caretta]